MGGGEPLDDAKVAQLSSISHVTSIQENVQTMYTGDAMESAVEMGTLGRRWKGQTGELTDMGNLAPPEGGAAFRMGITVMGFDPATTDPVLMGDAHMTVDDGRYFTARW